MPQWLAERNQRLRNASPRDRHFRRGAGGRGPGDTGAHGPARRHVFVRAARSVHPDLDRHRPPATAGKHSGRRFWLGLVHVAAGGCRVGCELGLARPRPRFSAARSPCVGFAIRVCRAQGLDRRPPGGFIEAEAAERAAAELPVPAIEVVTLEEALEMQRDLPFVHAGRDPLPRISVCSRRPWRGRAARATAAVYVIFVDEIPGCSSHRKAGLRTRRARF